MTITEERILLAKWEGWEFHPESGPLDEPWAHRPTKCRSSGRMLFASFDDLNAIRVIELKLTPDQWARYDRHLADVTNARYRKGRRNYVHLRAMISASADERTEALCRMIKEETT